VNLKGIRDTFRTRTDDKTRAHQYNDDASIDGLANEAVAEACVRARLLYDEDSSFLSIPITYGQAVYQLKPWIYEIRNAWLLSSSTADANNGRQLRLTDQSALDDQQSGGFPRSNLSTVRRRYSLVSSSWAGTNWREWAGHPLYLIRDQSRIQLVPIPKVTSPTYSLTLRLGVYRTPTDREEMSKDEDCPAIPNHWHARLIDWMLYRAYSNKDSEQEDPARAAEALKQFEMSFGKRQDANVIRKQSENRRKTVRCVWP
jgi:hypothetical protein